MSANFTPNLLIIYMVNAQVKDSKVNFRAGMTSISTQPAYNGIRDVLMSVYKEGGMRGLYRGVGMFVLHFIVFCM